MSEQDTSVTPATNEGQEQELEINLDTDTESVDVEAKTAKRDDAFRQVLARAKRAEDENKRMKASLATKTQETAQPSEPRVQLDEITDLRLDGYTRDEVAFIMKNGGRKSLESDPFVKTAIAQIREQRKAEAAIPAIDTGKSEIERKYTQEQLANMSAEELYKILPKSNR